MGMKQITYSLAELCDRIKEIHGPMMKAFSLRYPTDSRCRYSLRIFVACEAWDMEWYEAEDGKNVSELIGMNVVAVSWDRLDNDRILTVVVDEDKNNK